MSKPSRSPVIAITGLNAQADNPGPGLAVARCIHEAEDFNGTLIGLSYDALDPGLYLQGVIDSGHLLPYPSSGEEALFERLQTLHEQYHLDLLIPCLDAELPSFARLKPRLQALGIQLLLPEGDALRMRDKSHLQQLAQQADVESPETLALHEPRFFQHPKTGWDYPLVVKGLFYGAEVVHNPEQGRTAFQHIANQWGLPVLVQQHLQGEEINLSAIGNGDGSLIAPVMMKKRAVTDKGKAWAGITIDDPKLLQLAKRIAERMQWLGPLEIEVLKDAEGRYHLIEINPRFPAWIYLSVGAGRNLPAALVTLALHGSIPPFEEIRTGVLFLRYAQEVLVELDSFESMITLGSTPSSK